ncbi:MAG TPA: hypothetical protein VGY31_05520 [Terriglobia bacterium]|nr:hypothetical protein [Terriglobia bacterium]
MSLLANVLSRLLDFGRGWLGGGTNRTHGRLRIPGVVDGNEQPATTFVFR